MILSEISKLIVVDKFNNIENKENCTFFLSHLNTDLVVESEFSANIFTSSTIANFVRATKKQIPVQCLRVLQNKTSKNICLSNGETLQVTMFKDDLPSCNICFHFEVDSKTALYLGHFKAINKILWSQPFIDLLSKGVDFLYIDNTNSKSVYHSTANEVAYKFKDILRSHTKIILNTPEFGYEELIQTLILDFNFKVYIQKNSSRMVFHNTECFDRIMKNNKECEIAMIQDSQDLEFITRRLNVKKFATVRLFDFQQHFENNAYEKYGLYQLCYSSHISQMEMFALITIVQPTHIIEIYPEFQSIPFHIKSASKRWTPTEEELIETIQQNKELNEIEDFAPLTREENAEEILENYIENALSENQLTEKSNSNTNKIDTKTKSIAHSTDCEEIHDNAEELDGKIKVAVQKLPKRRKIKETVTTFDICAENKSSKCEPVQQKIKVEKSPQKQNDLNITKPVKAVANGSMSLYTNTDYSKFVLDETSSAVLKNETQFFTFRNDPAIALNSDAMAVAADREPAEKMPRENNENYFSFLDNVSLSSKKSSQHDNAKLFSESDKVDSTESLIEIKLQKSQSKDVQLLVKNTMKANQINVLKKVDKSEAEIFKITYPEKISIRKKLFKNRASTRTSKKNQMKCIDLTNSFVDRLIEKCAEEMANTDFIDEPIVPKIETSEEQNIKSPTNNKLSPRRQNIMTPEKHQRISSESGAVIPTPKKGASKNDVESSFDNRNMEQSSTMKKQTKNNQGNTQIERCVDRSISKKRRTLSDDSVEAIIDVQPEIVEIIDNSPPKRKTRVLAKSLPVEIKPKRNYKKPGAITKLYIDDDDDDDDYKLPKSLFKKK